MNPPAQSALFPDMPAPPPLAGTPPKPASRSAGSWPFGDLPRFGFDLIMADPPWPFDLYSEKGNAKSAQAKYRTMPFADIKAMPVGHLASGDAILFLWATWPLMLDRRHAGRSPVGEVIEAWGFRAVTGGSWAKTTTRGKAAFNTGYRVRNSCDPFLIAVTGKPDTSRAERNLIKGLQREHSRKPEAAYAWCERYLPGARRLDLFSRASRPGWAAWGDEMGKFDEAA